MYKRVLGWKHHLFQELQYKSEDLYEDECDFCDKEIKKYKLSEVYMMEGEGIVDCDQNLDLFCSEECFNSFVLSNM
jgi:hypothetical protein